MAEAPFDIPRSVWDTCRSIVVGGYCFDEPLPDEGPSIYADNSTVIGYAPIIRDPLTGYETVGEIQYTSQENSDSGLFASTSIRLMSTAPALNTRPGSGVWLSPRQAALPRGLVYQFPQQTPTPTWITSASRLLGGAVTAVNAVGAGLMVYAGLDRELNPTLPPEVVEWIPVTVPAHETEDAPTEITHETPDDESPLLIATEGRSWKEVLESLRRLRKETEDFIRRWNEAVQETIRRTNGQRAVPTDPDLWLQLFSFDSVVPANPSQPTLMAGQGAARAQVGSSTGLSDPEERERVRQALLRLAQGKHPDLQRSIDLNLLRRLSISSGVNHPAVSAAFRELENHQWRFAQCRLWRNLSLTNRMDLARRLAEHHAGRNEPAVYHNRRSQMITTIARTLNAPAVTRQQLRRAPSSTPVDAQLLAGIKSALTDQQRRTWDKLSGAFPNGGTDPITRIIGDRAGDLHYEIYRTALTSLIAVLLNSLEIYLRRNNLNTPAKMKFDPFLRRWFEPQYTPDGIVSGRAVPNLLGSFGVRGGVNRLVGAIHEFRAQARMAARRRSFEHAPADAALTSLLGPNARVNPDGLYRGVIRGENGSLQPVWFLVEIKSMTGIRTGTDSFMDPWMWRTFRVSLGMPPGKALRQFLRTTRVMRSHPNIGWHLILITNRGRDMTQEQQIQAAREHLAHALIRHGFDETEALSIMNRVRVTVLTTAPPPVRNNGQVK